MKDPRTGEANGAFGKLLDELYGSEHASDQRERIDRAFHSFKAAFPEEDAGNAALFSAPGRTELGGNHTDHNFGRVLAASVQLDAIAWVLPTEAERIEMISEGYEERISAAVDSASLRPDAAERGTPAALVRGVAAGVAAAGGTVGGFKAYITSDVLPGSGLSSSAVFEVLAATVLDDLYNEGRIGAVRRAKISQYAENEYFGKPCGLMDQLACAVGGVIAIDFSGERTGSWPTVRRVGADFHASGYALCVVDTGGSHADLTPDYASVPQEMKAVAAAVGCETLSETDKQTITGRIASLRTRLGDRAVLRALHFFEENDRVSRQFDLLEQGDVTGYLLEVRGSAHSSWTLLQNYFSPHAPGEQGIAMAAALTNDFLKTNATGEHRGAVRVHGGGFAGTVQAYIPEPLFAAYTKYMSACFGEGAVTPLRVRNLGVTRLL